MKKIIILDFSAAEVHVFPYDDNIWDDGEDFIVGLDEDKRLELRIQDCQWMIVDDLNIQIH